MGGIAAHHLPGPVPRLLSAIGLLVALVAVDSSASFPMALEHHWDFDGMRRLLDDLATQGTEVVSAAGVAVEAITNRYTVDMRYVETEVARPRSPSTRPQSPEG